MIIVPVCCGHPRLLHDSWGCRTKCGCGVSIIYLAPEPVTEEEAKELVAQGILFDRTRDRLEESRLRTLYQRAVSETTE